MLKNQWSTPIIQTWPLKFADPTIPHQISDKIKQEKMTKKSQKVSTFRLLF
jgi:hypothetical protein